ncbi:hypothetical protein ACFVZH_24520 [Streptomyces sp. NPDC059534]|uniref:hypothetical protein n=1 Tax=Streptomyces sp. NPDC059534 TaxID=3346859 RepID=UPI0036832358
MKLSPNSNPPEPTNLLIRLHNQTGAAVDVTGNERGHSSRWQCHGCGDLSGEHGLAFARDEANAHAAACRASYHRLG